MESGKPQWSNGWKKRHFLDTVGEEEADCGLEEAVAKPVWPQQLTILFSAARLFLNGKVYYLIIHGKGVLP